MQPSFYMHAALMLLMHPATACHLQASSKGDCGSDHEGTHLATGGKAEETQDLLDRLHYTQTGEGG
jgi:hypothetical protein